MGFFFFLIKQHPNGTIFKYKAHLVATRFHQHLDIDFHDTFSPIFKSTTFRVILTLALTNDWSLLHQLDVNNFFFFFFCGTLSKEVYLQQLLGIVDQNNSTFICKLWKAIYILK